MTFRKLIDTVLEAADDTYVITSKAKKDNGNHKYYDWEDNNDKFKTGRERLVSTVLDKIKSGGGHASRKKVRDYVYEEYKKWLDKKDSADWIIELENRAKGLGFNPRDYIDQEPGDSEGKGGPGDPEYDGRAMFFVGLTSGFANHFLPNKEENKKSEEKKNEND